jgi:two-component system chemotaxis response regulator CheB
MNRPRLSAKRRARSEERPLHVLVVDDSAVVRQIMASVLSQDERLTVAAAADPLIAMEKMRRQRPDVILLDLEMPRMDGLTFLRQLMAEENPIPVVICSGVAGQGTENAVRALYEGAVDIVAKPALGVADFLRDSAVMLIDSVYAAASTRVQQRSLVRAMSSKAVPAPSTGSGAREKVPRVASSKVVAVGASTGGPDALRVLLHALPPDAPGCLVVQHMPEPFTQTFARRLDEVCRIEVKQAADGDSVLQGRALIAPGNLHLLLRRGKGGYAVELRDGKLVSRHRPSVDVLFRSVAEVAGAAGMGVILTGMGGDGAEGLRQLKRVGATTIAQDEDTCVVFGMPKEAIVAGVVDEVAPLSGIADAILRHAAKSPAGRGRR